MTRTDQMDEIVTIRAANHVLSVLHDMHDMSLWNVVDEKWWLIDVEDSMLLRII